MQKLLYEINHEYSLITYISDFIISLLKCTSYYVETLYYIIHCIMILIRSIRYYSVILNLLRYTSPENAARTAPAAVNNIEESVPVFGNFFGSFGF